MKTKKLLAMVMLCITTFYVHAQEPTVSGAGVGGGGGDSILMHINFAPDAVMPTEGKIWLMSDDTTEVSFQQLTFDTTIVPFFLLYDGPQIPGIEYRVYMECTNSFGDTWYEFTFWSWATPTDVAPIVPTIDRSIRCWAANHQLMITQEQVAVWRVTVNDIMGRVVAETTVSELSQTIDLADQPAGMYVVRAVDERNKKVVTKKISLSE